MILPTDVLLLKTPPSGLWLLIAGLRLTPSAPRFDFFALMQRNCRLFLSEPFLPINLAMKKVFSSAIAIALTATACLAQTSSISFTNSIAAPGNGNLSIWQNLQLGKFDTSLGSLSGVVVTINFTTIGGSFGLQTTTNAPVSRTVTNIAAYVAIRQSTNNTLGYSQFGLSTNFVRPSVTPSLPVTFPVNSGITNFSIANTNLNLGLTQNIASGFWNAYQSIGGVGSVVFQVQNHRPGLWWNTAVPTNNFTILNASNFVATANMSVTYSYTPTNPIPEPGTWAAGALLLGGAAYTFWRRRQPVVAEEFAPAA